MKLKKETSIFHFLEDISPFLFGSLVSCYEFQVTSALAFKARVGPVPHRLHAMDSPDSPLVQHLPNYYDTLHG